MSQPQTMHWRLFVDCGDERKSLKVADRVATLLQRELTDVRVERCPDSGFRVVFQVGLVSTEWNDAIVEAIAQGQCIAHGWRIDGDVRESLSATAQKLDLIKVPGIETACWEIQRGA